MAKTDPSVVAMLLAADSTTPLQTKAFIREVLDSEDFRAACFPLGLLNAQVPQEQRHRLCANTVAIMLRDTQTRPTVRAPYEDAVHGTRPVFVKEVPARPHLSWLPHLRVYGVSAGKPSSVRVSAYLRDVLHAFESVYSVPGLFLARN